MDKMDIEKELIEEICNNSTGNLFDEIEFDEKTKSLLLKYSIIEFESNGWYGYYKFNKEYNINCYNKEAFFYDNDTSKDDIIRETVLYYHLSYVLIKLIKEMKDEITSMYRN